VLARRLRHAGPRTILLFEMAVRKILIYPDPTLKQVAEPVQAVDDSIRQLVEDMAETMYDAPGVGLAANQIGVLKRVFVIDIAGEDEPSNLRVFINPEILELSGTQTWTEGCLSFPGASEEIKRAARVRVRALDQNGSPFELEADGLLAVAIQHENDHLDGVLMIDKLNALKRRLLSSKLAKRRRRSDSAQPTA
jgi:peptide deformylase